MHTVGPMRDNQAVAHEDTHVAFVEEVDAVEVVDVDVEPVVTRVSDSHAVVHTPRFAALALSPEVKRGAVLALSSFAAGAITTVLRARTSSSRVPRRLFRKRVAEPKVVATRSFKIDVHLLDKP